ncbi:MAB_1171c family putative transporter [Streptomyces sp. NPDC127097]|uniref:MAB_1171c family putative transporter n=1 Tax=Streptomyces sp. NPDC127097 TaxID=3347136 RepID=UPI003661D460
MLFTVVAWITGVSALMAFCYKLPAARRTGNDPALVALCVYFLTSALSFLVDLEPFRTVLSGVLRYPNITTVLSQAAVIVLTAAQQVALVHWADPPDRAHAESRRRIQVCSAALIVVVTVFFLLDPLKHYGSAQTVSVMYQTEPHYAIHMGLYVSLCAIGQIEALRLSLRFVGLAQRSWLRRGMIVMSLGASLVLLYCGCRLTTLTGRGLGLDMDAFDPVGWLSGDVGSLLQIIGWTLPAWGVHLSAAYRWPAQYRAHRRLRPLWHAVSEAVPAITLDPPPFRRRGPLPPRDIGYCLYRAVIEIRDGQLALRPYADTDAVRRRAEALRLTVEPGSPTGEALLLHTALQARRSGPPAPPASSASFPHTPHDDFAKEVARLSAVARAFVQVDARARHRGLARPGSVPGPALASPGERIPVQRPGETGAGGLRRTP